MGNRPETGGALVGGCDSVGSRTQPGDHPFLQLWPIARIGNLSVNVDAVLGGREEPVCLANHLECRIGWDNPVDSPEHGSGAANPFDLHILAIWPQAGSCGITGECPGCGPGHRYFLAGDFDGMGSLAASQSYAIPECVAPAG
ncbi:MAG: hypothetical protein ABSF99_10200 [Anaerolineales bacterium]